MRPTFQRREDDCFAACIATLCDIPLPLVPAYAKRGYAYQLAAMQRWLCRLGLTYIEVDITRQRPRTGTPTLGILTVEVPSCDNLHAVVAEYHDGKVRVVHNPDRESARLGRRVAFGWLLPTSVPTVSP